MPTINTLATATLFQQTLDQVVVQEALTGWMEANAGQVLYNGGAEVKILKLLYRDWVNMIETMDIIKGLSL